MVGAGGKPEPASVMATDATSDIALVDVPEDLPVAPFADDAALDSGTPVLTLSYVPAGGTAIALHCTPGSVTGVGGSHRRGSGRRHALHHLVGTGARRDRRPAAADRRGQRGGHPLRRRPGSTSPVTFLPSDLVVGVADDLRSGDRVVRGWLGHDRAPTPPNGAGAKVETGRGARPGRQPARTRARSIVAVNDMPVRTMAELRGRLYVLPPGTAVALSVQGSPGATTVDVTLSRSP